MKTSVTAQKTAELTDPFFGKNWEISKRSSSFSSWKPDTEKRIYEKVGAGYRLTVSGIRDGKPYRWGYTATTDGQPCPVHGRSDVDAIEKHQITNLITVGSFTKDGKIVAEYRRVTASNGKTLTVVVSGRSPDGTAYFDVLKYKVVAI